MTYNPGKQAGEHWREDYSDMLLSFNREMVNAAILSFVRTEMDLSGMDEDEIYFQICIAFCKLYQRQAVAPIRPFSTEGQRMLDDILREFNVVAGDRPVDPELTVYEQVLEAFNGHQTPMSEIRKLRKDPQFEAAYVKALENGDIK
jgi:hypothetical protein